MKPILITLLSVALASSCANHEVKLLLTEAESLMQDHPDSALSIIESIDTAALMTKAQRADFSLLHAMALDKNYIDTTDLRVIAPAFRYFRNHGSDQNKMRTLYYQGRIYINADDYSNAVISLNNALEYAQGEEYLDKGRIYSALSVSYCNSHNNIEELTCSRHAYDYFLKSGSEKYLDSARYLLALSLRNNNLVDEADSVFNSIYSGKDSTARLSRTVMCAQASNCLQMDFPDYVKACELFGYLEKNGATFSENDILEYAFSLLNCGERGYGSDGNVSGVGYSTQDGVITTESYTYSYGHNTRISLPDGTLAWRLDSENDLGMPTSATTGSVTREYGYTSFGLPTYRRMDNGALQDFTYQFDVTTGNLLVRQDGVNGQAETFGYDNLNRLTAIGGRQISYSDNGNVISMDGVGTMSYENGSKPYQITSLHPADEALVPSRAQSVSYTCYSRPSILTEGGRSAAFTYNGDGDRVKMYVADGTAEVLTRHYIGSRYEHDHTPSGSKERLYLGGDAYSALMVYQRENGGSWTLYNIGRDYLGNVTHIATSGGTLVAEYSYDPWGRLRDPDTHAVYSPGQEPELFLGRGFTGHEHLPWFGLVNMNARLYDPLLGRFLSPDPYVQAPDFTQNYNRYIYCLNNPLKFTDRSGEIFWLIPVITGAVIGSFSGYMIGSANDATGWNMVGYIAGGALIGGLSGGASVGINVAGGGAMLAGAGSGAVGGAGFSGLATGWDRKAMFKGAVFGAISNFIGSGVAASIGGGWGAFAGGVSANLISQLLYNRGDFSRINWASAGLSGVASFGMYHGMQYMQYRAMGRKLGELDVTYQQYSKINTAYQRSRFWGKEYGLYLNRDGSARFVPAARSHKLSVEFSDFRKGDIATTHFHWAKEGVDWVDVGGQGTNFQRYNPDLTYPEGSSVVTTVGGYHSPADLMIPGYSIVVGRTSGTYSFGNGTFNYFDYDPFLRLFLFPWIK